jgi:hypothetical protein
VSTNKYGLALMAANFWEQYMLKKSIPLFALGAIAFGLVACDVDQTQKASATMPKYEVTKTQEGNVTPPKYEVTPPDVKVSKQEQTIEVPTIRKEEKTVDVPKVEVTPAKDK